MCDHIYITAYWGEWEVMRIITPFVTEKINLTRENVERLRLRCQDLLAGCRCLPPCGRESGRGRRFDYSVPCGV